ncbi:MULTISPECIES: methylmalonyl-CoA epimerase [Selenomonas]|uniref:Methylmalonyl-CoA epimerase n=1 Tax=Selenomonas ruminis TaxID=2593411 RepID=A0A5D6W3P5_9FIRM|nr:MULTISPECIES: methylmalonyl-CoA epimerase [unclassified Selenomonas]MBQ1867611.1 methylmalonyl-CoA epimerase [Selenomonas sp.]MDD6135372.1 methylmalonyl-CoA epimerase [Selenomonadaceae bacterium]TYZ22547.1 methylmalonyl-CoA epimerase [Selenomonas sp. mPRGC5]
MFKVLGVDHIGIAVSDLKEVGSFWGDTLGLPANGEETVAEQKVTTGFFPTPNGSEIELLAATDETSPIAKFIEKNGGRGGIQHIALRVDNLEAALADLKEQGVRLIDEKPRLGAGGAKIAFVHPKASHGVLLELCQRD